MSRARNLANILGSDGSFGSADITTALGYTPVNKAGDTLTGPLYVPRLRMNNFTMKSFPAYSNGASTGVNRIGYIARHYWGAGPVYITVMHAYYSDFRRSMYVINGDTKLGDGADGLSIVTEYNGGAVNAPYIGPYTNFSGSSIDQYAEIRISVPSYQQYMILFECANIDVFDQNTPPPNTNSVCIPDTGVII
jgi:hypothetical protein